MRMFTVAILTISDRCARGEQKDITGPLIQELLDSKNFVVISHEIISDSPDIISVKLIEYADNSSPDLILTNGGTGFGPRDNTPEATLRVIEKNVPGIPEMMRREGVKISRRAALSRAVAGIRKNTFIINLPGSPQGAKESLGAIIDILPHAIEMLHNKPH